MQSLLDQLSKLTHIFLSCSGTIRGGFGQAQEGCLAGLPCALVHG